MSINGSISFYAGCPEGHSVSYNGSNSFLLFFFFVVATNLYVNLFINLSPLLLGKIVLIIFKRRRSIKIHSCRLYREGK